MSVDYDENPMTDDELQDAATHIGERFEDHDTRFLALMSPEQRAGHLQALRMLYEHIGNIWQAPKQADGPHPVELGGYGAVAGLRDMVDVLIGHVEDVQHVAGDEADSFRARMVVNHVD
ncbi:hypothetical protein [Micromonospora peucetia]|uniref:Uncharacterized protein n=1 Tax=Micromonospora peucetia TaxID=47871 RepID=A0A1C6VV24_9ACTN|nr:hypothetical protein [Micromonospora peucetia]SCL69740.1 hypothetical protein GA0070608_4115 [Micromonospora peucetia]